MKNSPVSEHSKKAVLQKCSKNPKFENVNV